MFVLRALSDALAWLGRQGTRAVALSVFAGIALPPVAALFKPYFTPALFLLLSLAFLRVQPSALQGHLRQPRLVLIASVWMMVVLPTLYGLGLLVITHQTGANGLSLALMLQAMAPPIGSAPALAALMGLDASLTLAALIVCTVLTPLTAPLLIAIFIGPEMALSPLDLGLRLAALLAGAAILAAGCRALAGAAWIDRQKDHIDGLNVITLFFFAVALMDGFAANVMKDPLLMLGLFLLAFAMALVSTVLTTFVLLRAGAAPAFALGLAAGSRNVSLLIAAAGGNVPELVWLYVAMVQFPIYLLPQILKPLAGKVNAVRSG